MPQDPEKKKQQGSPLTLDALLSTGFSDLGSTLKGYGGNLSTTKDVFINPGSASSQSGQAPQLPTPQSKKSGSGASQINPFEIEGEQLDIQKKRAETIEAIHKAKQETGDPLAGEPGIPLDEYQTEPTGEFNNFPGQQELLQNLTTLNDLVTKNVEKLATLNPNSPGPQVNLWEAALQARAGIRPNIDRRNEYQKTLDNLGSLLSVQQSLETISNNRLIQFRANQKIAQASQGIDVSKVNGNVAEYYDDRFMSMVEDLTANTNDKVTGDPVFLNRPLESQPATLFKFTVPLYNQLLLDGDLNKDGYPDTIDPTSSSVNAMRERFKLYAAGIEGGDLPKKLDSAVDEINKIAQTFALYPQEDKLLNSATTKNLMDPENASAFNIVLQSKKLTENKITGLSRFFAELSNMMKEEFLIDSQIEAKNKKEVREKEAERIRKIQAKQFRR